MREGLTNYDTKWQQERKKRLRKNIRNAGKA